MIHLEDASLAFPTRTVLQDASWHVAPGDRVGLVGANGAGKSTLLKILLGQIGLDTGRTRLRPGARIGYLAQDLPGLHGRTLQSEMWTAFEAILAQQAELDDLARSLQQATDPARQEALAREQARATERFEAMGGYEAEAKIGKVLAGLGFSEADRSRLVETFSGGWQMRVNLARLLLMQPEVLLLDEPTNHLDIEAIEWLEAYLGDYPGTVVVISHDRRFLDRVVTRITELDQAKLEDYPGTYSQYLEQRIERRAARQAAFDRQQRELGRQQAYIDRFRASATRSTQAKSREKQIAKIERLEAPKDGATVRFAFPPAPPSGQSVLIAGGLARGFGERRLFEQLDLKLERGDRLALVGPNGCGKSTLIRLLAGIDTPDQGEVVLGYQVKMAYYAQQQADQLDETRTVLDEAYRANEDWTLERVRGLLARFLFSQDDVMKTVAKLSGGERARLCLARMLMRPANLLLLDEPTNHLDLASKETLAEALETFEGTVVLISHDRELLGRVSNRVLAFEETGPRAFLGSYDAYRETRSGKPAAPMAPSAASGRPGSPEPRTASKGSAPPAPEAPAGGPKKLNSFQRARKLETLEAEIAQLEARIGELEPLTQDPDFWQDHVRAGAVTEELRELRDRHEEATEAWFELSQ
ncbi:MAG: ABC-F family ATP-binding cassette domain-containing protein [bacterium]|nr:ABC-F family ATP-binding cassette domain-containing protein [bacterium]